MSKLFGLTALALAFAGLALADDKKPDWSGFVAHSTMTGEVAKVDATGFTLHVQKTMPGATPKSKPKIVTEKLRMPFAEQGLVRWKMLPPKLDEKGKKLAYTDKELKALRLPSGTTGYAAERSDLLVGHLVEVTLVRPKEIPLNKVVFQDLVVKQALIVGSTTVAMPVKGKKPEEKKK